MTEHSALSVIISSLKKNHDRNDFNCGNVYLDNYLQHQANQDAKKNVSVTYVATLEESVSVIGYYTLSNHSVFVDQFPNEVIKKIPKYPILPTILIGRLAVDENFHKKKLGSFLLINAFQRILSISSQIGIFSVIVEAKNENAVNFYKRMGFIQFKDNPDKLFYLIESIKKLFSLK